MNFRNKKTLSLGILISLIGCLVAFIKCGRDNENVRNKTNTIERISVVSFEDDGETYTVEAISGQVVFFAEDAEVFHVNEICAEYNCKVISSIPEIGYYLFEVDAGTEGNFINKIQEQFTCRFVYPNAIYYPCALKAFVLDDFMEKSPSSHATHGEMVSYSMNKIGNYNGDRNLINVARLNYRNQSYYLSHNRIIEELYSIIHQASDDDKIVINMSFGPGFDYNYWTDPEVTDYAKKSYKNSCAKSILEFLSVVESFVKKDFVIVKAAGNEGIKDFGGEIIDHIFHVIENDNDLRQSRKELYKTILNESFIFVSAKDDDFKEYSNDMAPGEYNPLVTAVDISSLEYKNAGRIHGTSFAAPGLAGMIATLIDSYDISAEEALALVRETTKLSSDNVIDFNTLEKKVKKYTALITGGGYVEKINGAKIMMVNVEGGTLADTLQGQPKKVDQFYMSETEITQAQWEAVMGELNLWEIKHSGDDTDRYFSNWKIGDNYPMYCLALQADEFCERLSELTGKKYVLPTDVQWEFAARGGVKSQGYFYSGSNNVNEVAWHNGNCNEVHQVGELLPNELGLYDMSGNVWEWCSDSDEEGFRYRRGGVYYSSGHETRVANRSSENPSPYEVFDGFRVVCIDDSTTEPWYGGDSGQRPGYFTTGPGYGSSGSSDYMSEEDMIEMCYSLVYAVADGDITLIKKITTDRFQREEFHGMSDEEIKRVMLSRPYSERERHKRHFREHSDTIVLKHQNNISVMFTNVQTGKVMTMRLIQTSPGKWKIDEVLF